MGGFATPATAGLVRKITTQSDSRDLLISLAQIYAQSRAATTHSQYGPLWSRWLRFCTEQGISHARPAPSSEEMASFLQSFNVFVLQ